MAAVVIMLVTLLIMMSALVLNHALEDTLDDIAKEITISAFLYNDADREKIDQLREEINQDVNVRSVTFVPQEEAQQLYVELYGDDDELLSAVSRVDQSEAFPPSLVIELIDLSRNQNVVDIFNDPRYENVIEDYDKDRLATVSAIGDGQQFVSTAGIVAGGIFALISVLVIFNTIRMAIFSRSEEIRMMKLIGATNNYIRGPFVVEASMYGVVSGLVACGIVLPFLPRVQPFLENNKIVVAPTVALIEQNTILIIVATVAVGVLLGVISSLLAMSRYLRFD